MKINEVEAAVGVTKKNIRFYEEEGLITPSREPGNGYRSYSQADVERLRRIKLLRKLDVPLAEIREMLEGQKTLAEGMGQQLERLNARRKDLDEAIGFCTVLEKASLLMASAKRDSWDASFISSSHSIPSKSDPSPRQPIPPMLRICFM